MQFRTLGLVVGLLALASAAQADEALRLTMPEPMLAVGFDKHLLTRFTFRTRIAVVATTGAGDMALSPDPGPDGTPVFAARDGTAYALQISNDPEGRATAFLEWLRSDVGRKAIESFPSTAAPAFAAEITKPKPQVTITFDGDAAKGEVLARQHCQRCHVVALDKPFAGIGSTPSFFALKAIPYWAERFPAFWAANPHRALIEVVDVNAPHADAQPVPIAPLVVTLDEIADIMAYVAQLPVRDLGAPITSAPVSLR